MLPTTFWKKTVSTQTLLPTLPITILSWRQCWEIIQASMWKLGTGIANYSSFIFIPSYLSNWRDNIHLNVGLEEETVLTEVLSVVVMCQNVLWFCTCVLYRYIQGEIGCHFPQPLVLQCSGWPRISSLRLAWRSVRCKEGVHFERIWLAYCPKQ